MADREPFLPPEIRVPESRLEIVEGFDENGEQYIIHKFTNESNPDRPVPLYNRMAMLAFVFGCESVRGFGMEDE